MELFPPLTDFYNAIAQDSRIGATHISLFMALLQQWNLNKGANPILIKREKVMKAAKISSRHTYNRCINDLHNYNYIIYKPSVNASVQTEISINFKKEVA
jgi:hypothetical protein